MVLSESSTGFLLQILLYLPDADRSIAMLILE
jgi:hypothetical protein